MSENNDYLTVDAVSDLLHVSSATLRRWRKIGRGPAFIKMGPSGSAATIVYPRDALDEWLRANTFIPKNH